jgi:hypothetical protein
VVVSRTAPWRAVLVLITVGTLLGGCRSGGKAEPTAPPVSATSSASPSASASATADTAALAAYRGMWNAFVEAAKVPDPSVPQLRQYASEDALKRIVGSLVIDRDQGKVVKGPLIINPSVTSLKPADRPTEATITDCVDATNWLEYKKSGELWDNKPGGKHHTTATVKLTNGTWKVSSFTLEVKGTC